MASVERALLLTDVVDSTRLTEELGDAAVARLWARHDRVARDLLTEHRGREIDKTDGFLLLFESAREAVDYALAYHRALRELRLSARAGLHVGPTILTENNAADVARGAKPLEVDGLAKPVAARVMSVALGGQTLLTAHALKSLGDVPWRTESHGHWRAKGITWPIELFEVGDDAAPFRPPPDSAKVWRVVQVRDQWLPVREVPHDLPAERDAFVGRAADLLDLARRIDNGARVVSLLGPGGTGKTRLAVRFAWTWLGDWPGGAWFCDLSEARDLDGVLTAVARVLQVPLVGRDPVTLLGHAIAGRGSCLLVLDNFEQVARFAAPTLGQWLDRARDARFVVTTREVLGLPGEQVLPLAPLVEDDAVELFLTRARAAGREVLSDERVDVEALVALLDALPLAVELAAARVRLMPPKVLLQRMKERFKVLAGSGARTARHASLRGTLDWSWELSTDAERSALAQLSTFHGGFGLEAAEAVIDLTAFPDAPWTLDLLQALVDKSWVRAVSPTRLDLLVTVQDYAAEQLVTEGRFPGSGPAAARAAEARHGAWFASDPDPDTALALGNRTAACRRAVARGDAFIAAGALERAWKVLDNTGPASAGLELADAVLGMPGLGPGDALRARSVAGEAALVTGRYAVALAHFEACRQLARAVGDAAREDRAGASLAQALSDLERTEEARAAALEVLAQARARGNAVVERSSLKLLDSLAMRQGRLDEADAWSREALALTQRIGDRHGEATVLSGRGIIRLYQRRLDEARRDLETALAAGREIEDRNLTGAVLCNLGNLALWSGRPVEAVERYREALPHLHQGGHRAFEGTVLKMLGRAESTLGAPDAARHLEQSLALARQLGSRSQEADVHSALGLLALDQGDVERAERHAADALAAERDAQGGVVLSRALRLQAAVHHAQGRLDAARDTLLQALASPGARGDQGLSAQLQGELAAVLARTGSLEEARAALRAGLAMARAYGDETITADLLTHAAEVELQAGASDAARVALTEAEELAFRAGCGPGSPLRRRLSALRGPSMG